MPLGTPLFRNLRSLLQHELRNSSEDIRLSRRAFLKSTAAGVALLAADQYFDGTPTLRAKTTRSVAPRIAIAGAGAAGLTAAYALRKHGLASTVYEASNRTGGRILTAHNLFAAGGYAELGGEFIDTGHTALLSLADELGILHSIDRTTIEVGLEEHTYYFEGRRRTKDELLASFAKILPKVAADIATLPDSISYHTSTDALRQLDRRTLEEYLHSLGGDPWFARMLDRAYLSEYAIETAKQSPLNFLTLIKPDASEFEPYGESDERFKIRGGNGTLTDRLAHPATVRFGHRLTSLTKRGSSYNLTFSTHNQTSVIAADIVILAIPFSTLRNVELQLELSAEKLRAIRELQYGTPSKVIAGLHRPTWRASGSSGYTITEQPFQCGWDSSEGHTSGLHSYTFFVGGTEGKQLQNASNQAPEYLAQLDLLFPGSSLATTGKQTIVNWSANPYALGGYAAYAPGQWTSFGGAESEPAGDLFFAGEHCSSMYQGFMNGAVETGLKAANQVLAAVNR